MSPRIQAPRGTYDVLGDDALARTRSRSTPAGSSRRAGYARIETPAFEATELFARGVGESTDVVQKEMYTIDEGPSESLTLRPEGTAPVCRAYLEHGMHKLPQPVKLWYLSSFFRRERPQAGPLPPVLAGRGGGDRLRRPGGRRRADPAALRAARDGRGARAAAAAVEPRHARDARAVPRRPPGLPARARGRAVRRGALAHRPQPAARVRRRPSRHAPGDGGRAAAARPPRRRGRGALRDRARAARRGRRAYEVDPTLVRGLDYYTRTVFEFTSDALGAQSGVGGGGRYDGLMEIIGGAPTPGMGWAAGVERILLCLAGAPGRAAAAGPLRRLRRARARAARRSASPPTRAAPGTPRGSSSAGAR